MTTFGIRVTRISKLYEQAIVEIEADTDQEAVEIVEHETFDFPTDSSEWTVTNLSIENYDYELVEDKRVGEKQ